MSVDYNSFSPFWILINKTRKILKKSEYFHFLKHGEDILVEFPSLKSHFINIEKDTLKALGDKILELYTTNSDLKFRGTSHQINNDLLIVCWPAINKIDDVAGHNLHNQMLHPACYLMDTLIIKDVLTRTQIKSRDNFLKKVEAEQLKKVSEEFFANMSHEIRTPLNGLLGMIQLLSDNQLSQEQRSLLNTMEYSGKALLRVLNDILDFSKINSGKIDIEFIPFNLKELLESCITLMSQVADQKKIKLYLNQSHQLDCSFIGDPVRIRQIVTNYISNGIKFTEDGEVNVSVLMDPIEGMNYSVKIIVSDTGVGIAKEKHDKLFNAFTQADSSTTRKFGGTGLGLSISAQLAQIMGGKVGFTSTENIGSTFYLELPLRKQNEGKKCEQNINEELVTKFTGKVLVVEDNKVNQKVVELMLKKFEVNCDIAENGYDALKFLEKHSYSLILMDMQLPDISGIETTKKIIEKYQKDSPPIVALTANAFKDDREACLKVGMSDFLAKPLQLNQLQNVLFKYLKL